VSDFATARASMIDCQLRPNEVNDERIISVMSTVPREVFLPKAKRSIAYVDEDIEVRDGRYLMEPVIFGKLLVAAKISKDDLVLDIGCASGYSSAVIAGLCDAVVALETTDEMVALAEKKLAALDVMNVAVVKGDLAAGVAKQGPFDVIFIEGAVQTVPSILFEQLREGGRLLCVKLEDGVGRGHMIAMKDGKAVETELFDANVHALSDFQNEASFVF